jgi:hypothetical protein
MEQLPNRYDVLTLPLEYNKSFLDLNKVEVKQYYQWFLNIKDSRLAHLCGFLFANAENCLSEERLNVVETLLQHSVSTISKSKEQFNSELDKVPAHLKPYAKPDDYLLDKKTISICYDVGIYLGELIIKLDNRIRWKLQTDDEYADYGQPILGKSNTKFDVNPFRVSKNVAAKIYEGRYADGQLIGFFNAWKKAFKVEEGGSVGSVSK